MGNNIILTGPPRSGTTLACSLLNQLPDTAALHEPMNLKMFPNPIAAISQVQQFFSQMRSSILETGTALSKVKGEGVPENPFADDQNARRKSVVQKGILKFDKPFSPDFQLIIKQNGHFTYLLPGLTTFFDVYAILRHPVATILSWNTIQAPVAEGNLRVLENLDPELYDNLQSIPDLLERQVQLLVTMYDRFTCLEANQIIYYENLVSSGGGALQSITEKAQELETPLSNKNRNPLYDQKLVDNIKERLLMNSEVFSLHYSIKEIENF